MYRILDLNYLMMNDKEAFYAKLEESLNTTTKFPAEYMYKFIVPAGGNQVQEIESLFVDKSAKFAKKASKTGKYFSVSIRVVLGSSKEVILYYKKAENIKGIISL